MPSERIQSRIGGSPMEDLALKARRAEIKRTGSERQALAAAYLALGYIRGDLEEEEVAKFLGPVQRPREQAAIIAQRVSELLGDNISMSGPNDIQYVDDVWENDASDFFDP